MDKAIKMQFEKDGRFWFRDAISKHDLSLLDNIANLHDKAGQRIAVNEDLLSPIFSENSSIMQAIHRIDPQAKPVRIIAFNKSKDKNWGVPWHQDRIIAVSQKHNIEGFTNWSQKTGIWHCEPPQDLLDKMLFVRIHLDDTDAKNGAMKIAIGSHRNGIVLSEQADQRANTYPIESCDAKRGDVLILKMLTLHSSEASDQPSSRRVFRIDFASFDLPNPLKWAY